LLQAFRIFAQNMLGSQKTTEYISLNNSMTDCSCEEEVVLLLSRTSTVLNSNWNQNHASVYRVFTINNEPTSEHTHTHIYIYIYKVFVINKKEVLNADAGMSGKESF